MPYESVGPNYSGGVEPDYASKLGAIQQGAENNFADYTNPFMNMKGIQGEVLPWLQQANQQKQTQSDISYRQGMLGIDQQRQNLAQTAQDTLLPLQANYLGTQADALTAEVSARNFALSKQQDAYSQAPDYYSALSTAVQQGNPSAIYDAMSKNPAAAMTYGQDSMNALNYSDQTSRIRNAGVAGSAMQQGMDYAAQNPDASPTDYGSSLQQNPGENSADFAMRKTAQIQGFAQKQAQVQQVQQQAQNQQILAQIRQGGTIKAAQVRALGMGIRSGQTTVDQIEQMAPGLGVAAYNAANGPASDFTQDPTKMAPPVSKYPEQMQVEALKHYNTIMEGAGTPEQKQAAAAQLAVISPALAPSLGAQPSYDPVTNAQLDGLNAKEKQAQMVIQQAQTDPTKLQPTPTMFGFGTPGPSPVDQAQQTIQEVEQQRAQILRGQTGQVQSQMQPKGQPAPNTNFGQNPFMPASTSFNVPGYGNVDLNGGSAPIAVPGNPMTQAALNQTGALNVTPATKTAPAQVVAPSQAANPEPAKIDPDQVMKARQWLQANPKDPRAQQIRAKLQAAGVTDV